MRLRVIALAVVFAFIGGGYFAGSLAWGADPLRYRFTATTAPTYEISVRADTPQAVETQSGYIYYAIKSVDPVNGQITFGYAAHSHRRATETTARPWRLAAAAVSDVSLRSTLGIAGHPDRCLRQCDPHQPRGGRRPSVLYAGPVVAIAVAAAAARQSDYLEDAAGNIAVHQERTAQELAPRPSLAAATTRRAGRACGQRDHHLCWGRATATRLPFNASTICIPKKKLGDSPVEKLSGDGQYVFDTQLGLVRSLKSGTLELNQQNITLKVPILVSARLLTAAETAKLQADQEAVAAKAKEDIAAMQAHFAKDAVDALEKRPNRRTDHRAGQADSGRLAKDQREGDGTSSHHEHRWQTR